MGLFKKLWASFKPAYYPSRRAEQPWVRMANLTDEIKNNEAKIKAKGKANHAEG